MNIKMANFDGILMFKQKRLNKFNIQQISHFWELRLLPRNKTITESWLWSYFSAIVLSLGNGLFFGNKRHVYIGIVNVNVALGNWLIPREEAYSSEKAHISETVLFLVLFLRYKPFPRNKTISKEARLTFYKYVTA